MSQDRTARKHSFHASNVIHCEWIVELETSDFMMPNH